MHHRLFFVVLLHYITVPSRNGWKGQAQLSHTLFSDRIHSNSNKFSQKRNRMMGLIKNGHNYKKWVHFSSNTFPPKSKWYLFRFLSESYIILGDLFKYPQNQKRWLHGQKRKKINSPAHPFLLIKTCIHETHKIPPPPPILQMKSLPINGFANSIKWNWWIQIPREENASKV